MTLTSEAARSAALDPSSPEVWITLAEITHTELDAPIRIASYPLERLSSDPLRYGVRALGEVWIYAGISLPLPDRTDEGPATVSLSIDLVAPEVSDVADLGAAPALVTLRVVTGSTPDVVEDEWRRLEVSMTVVDQDEGSVRIDLQRLPIMDEPVVRDRMTVDRFPGLHQR